MTFVGQFTSTGTPTSTNTVSLSVVRLFLGTFLFLESQNCCGSVQYGVSESFLCKLVFLMCFGFVDFFAVKLVSGDNQSISQDPLFSHFSASPAECEVLSEIAVADSGVVHFPSVTLAGFIGRCTLSFLVHFAGGQKATKISLDAVITRTVMSSVITPISLVAHSVTVDVPFMISRECITAVFRICGF